MKLNAIFMYFIHPSNVIQHALNHKIAIAWETARCVVYDSLSNLELNSVNHPGTKDKNKHRNDISGEP